MLTLMHRVDQGGVILQPVAAHLSQAKLRTHMPPSHERQAGILRHVCPILKLVAAHQHGVHRLGHQIRMQMADVLQRGRLVDTKPICDGYECELDRLGCRICMGWCNTWKEGGRVADVWEDVGAGWDWGSSPRQPTSNVNSWRNVANVDGGWGGSDAAPAPSWDAGGSWVSFTFFMDSVCFGSADPRHFFFSILF